MYVGKSGKLEVFDWKPLIGSLIALVAGLVATLLAGTQLFSKSGRQTSTDAQFIGRIETIRQELSAQAMSIKAISARLEALGNLPSGSEAAVQLTALRTDFAGLDKRVQEIETAIVANPTKALAVPLLRQDLETVKLNAQKESESQAKQIDRIYDQNKWFIGLMFTMAIGIIGLAVSNFLQARKAIDDDQLTTRLRSPPPPPQR